MAKKKKEKVDVSGIDDNKIYLMTEGLTRDLIKIKNEELLKEFLEVKEENGLEEDDDDTNLYRNFIGHKIATLLNVTEHLMRQNEMLRETILGIDEGLTKLFPKTRWNYSLELIISTIIFRYLVEDLILKYFG